LADETTQRAVHKFFMERLQTLEPFTKKDLQDVTGWQDKALDTYWSKQYKGLVEDLGNGQYRMRERFRLYSPWKKFQALVTQVRTIPPTYAPTVFDQIVTYEFYLPLAHEAALRVTLDSLFYRDALLPRLKRIGMLALEKKFSKGLTQSDDDFLESILAFIQTKFGGYSTYHVDGRFRGGDLCTQDAAAAFQKTGQRYLVDETTAVVRFIFPTKDAEPDQVRFLFEELFINAITEQVSGEDEIWVVESGLRNRVSIWKPGQT
jgi:hypothetical protein